jgi:hypothetical protein
MSYGDNFKIAKSKAKELIESLADGSFGAVFPLIPNDNSRPEVTEDKRKMIENLENLTLSYSFTYNERRLEEIFGHLANAPNQKKEVILLTDFQRNGWTRENFQREWFIPVDVTSGMEIENRAISDVDFKDQKDSVKIGVRISNYSKAPAKDLLATVLLGNDEIKGFLEIEPGGDGKKDFIFPKERIYPGEISGRVQIAHDNLAVDDVRYFVLPQTREFRVLIVDGDPREEARLSETYYLGRAVETISEIIPLNLLIKDNDAFFDERLEEYNLVILANVGDLTPQKAREVEGFIEGGGVALIFLGDRVKSSVYNTLFKDILPGEVGNISEGNYSLTAPWPNTFSREINEKLSQVEIKKLFHIQPGQSSQIILSASDGSPFLIRREVKSGSVFLFASTADISWNSFPLTPVFLPIIKSIFDLSHSTQSKKRNFIVGESIEIEFSNETREATVRNPRGEVFKVSRENPRFDKTLIPGIYGVEESGKTKYNFAVNVDPRESNLERVSLKAVSSPGIQSGAVKVFKEIWNYFLWGAIVLFISESVFRALSS